MSEHKLAQRVEINRSSGEVLIDGDAFPYFLADEPISITVSGSGAELSVVRLALVVDPDGVVLFDGTAPEPGEHQVPPAESEEDGE